MLHLLLSPFPGCRGWPLGLDRCREGASCQHAGSGCAGQAYPFIAAHAPNPQQCRCISTFRRSQHAPLDSHSSVSSAVTGLQTPSCVSAEQLPVCWPDAQGHPCLVVLPSEQPSSRREAASIEQLLHALLAEPVSAAERYATAACRHASGHECRSLAGVVTKRAHMCLACTGLFWQVYAHVTGLSSVVVFLPDPSLVCWGASSVSSPPKLRHCRAAAWREFQLETTCMPMLNVLGLLEGSSTSEQQARNGLRLAGTYGPAQHLAPAVAKSAVAGRVCQPPPVALPASSADAAHLQHDASGSHPSASHAEGAERQQAEQDSTAAADAEVSRAMASAPGLAAQQVSRQPAGQLSPKPGWPLGHKSRAGQVVILDQQA